MVLETRVFHAANGEDVVILACTIFDWSTNVTNRQTELWWLRRTKAVAALARKKQSKKCTMFSYEQNNNYRVW